MRKTLLWFLTAQKFIFVFISLFGSIPITYTFADTLFDNGFLIVLAGLTVYALSVIPLTYAIVLGYDAILFKLASKAVEMKEPGMGKTKQHEIELSVNEKNSIDKGIEEFTLMEVDKTESKVLSTL